MKKRIEFSIVKKCYIDEFHEEIDRMINAGWTIESSGVVWDPPRRLIEYWAFLTR